ncbi:hypothetical protein [Streptomyces mexicanus]|jgi:hypothetical protein|uniref:hypothetical protein n=1 Tax=Streptomyces mexicanus TaxID=178566 RepID=UPI0031E55000
MSTDLTCEKLREIGPELALGVLPGRERAGAVEHLERCADCRERIRQLTEVGDRLIGLLPGSEPPVGFETRVAQALTQGATGREGRTRGRAYLGLAGLRGRRIRPRLAAAAAALLVAIGFGGWSVGTAIEDTLAPPAPTTAQRETDLLWGGLTSTGAHAGRPAGEVYAHPGYPGWIYMSVDLTGAGTSYTGKVSCLLVRRDGGTVPAGSFSLRGGRGSWGAPIPDVDRSTLVGARLTASDGRVLATTHFATGAET